jgi:toluene monooxygenase system ferredoxin subunit
MAFVSVCKTSDVREGQLGWYRVSRKSVLVVWPKNGTIRAFRGRCPHQDLPLHTATLQGESVVCGFHQWRFDPETGASVAPRGCSLRSYPVRLEQDEVQVELD